MGAGQVSVVEGEIPKRLPGFALLQLLVAGICKTDLELQRGYYQFRGIPGHEFVARVIEADDAGLAGARVVGEINLACGRCDFCYRHLQRHCSNRTVLGIRGWPGAFSSYFTLPETNLHVVANTISDMEAVFAEPLAAACEILDQVQLEPNTSVAVLGDGKLGLLITQVLLAHRTQVTLYGHHEEKLALARACGAQAILQTRQPSAAYQYVIECTGSAGGVEAAIQMTLPRGTIVLKSTIHEPVRFDMAPVIVNEISLIGSRCGRFEPALHLLEKGRLNVRAMIAAEFSLQQAPEAFAKASEKGVLKVLLRNTDI